MIDAGPVFIQAIFGIALLIIAALGLAIIFGMMGVINLAHGAFILVGAYSAVTVTNAGLSFWFAFVVAPVVVGVIGLITERLVIHRLYDRPIDTLLATWGIALVIQEVVRIVFGTSSQSVANPLSVPLSALGTSFSTYRIFLTALAAGLVGVTYVIFKFTDFGTKSRAVIQNDKMAGALGTNVDRIYSITFVIGAMLAGIAGAAIAPIVTVDPNTGIGYLVQSFIAVIVGGTGQIIAGAVGGASVVSGPATVVSFFSNQTFAQAIVLVLAIVVIRLKPQGLFPET